MGLQDDMGAIKIEDIVDAIMLNKDDGAAKNIKQELMIGLKLDDENDDNDIDNDENDEKGDLENMPTLYVKPKEVDPNSEPYKPIYRTANVIQKFGKHNTKKTNETTEDETSDSAMN